MRTYVASGLAFLFGVIAAMAMTITVSWLTWGQDGIGIAFGIGLFVLAIAGAIGGTVTIRYWRRPVAVVLLFVEESEDLRVNTSPSVDGAVREPVSSFID